VIAGIGQVANKDPDRILHPADLLETAARIALADAGIPAARVDGVLATPLSVYSREDASVSIAARLGLRPGLRHVSSYSGAAPQQLIAQACRAILDGSADVILVAGGIADASVRNAHRLGIEPPAPPTSRWSQGSEQPMRTYTDVRGEYSLYVPEMAAGAGLPSAYFALVESVLARGQDPDAHRSELGHLLAGFTRVAAEWPDLAWFPTARTAAEISEAGPDNRLIAEPYTKLMCSFPTVDLAGAIVVARDGSAGRSDRPAVRPLGIVTGREPAPPSGRREIACSAVLCQAVERVQTLTGIDVQTVARFDLYSCFPAAVQLASNALGLTPDDPRPRTATGGLPYFGGPGASYSIHGIACLIEKLRSDPESIAGAVSLGGMVSDFAVGFYGTADAPCRLAHLDTDELARVAIARTATGEAIVDAATVLHDREHGPVAAPIIARLPDGRRAGAKAADPALPAALAGKPSLVGQPVMLRMAEDGHVVYLPK
jgi:acetyl-CoA C-acetyltransferase